MWRRALQVRRQCEKINTQSWENVEAGNDRILFQQAFIKHMMCARHSV